MWFSLPPILYCGPMMVSSLPACGTPRKFLKLNDIRETGTVQAEGSAPLSARSFVIACR